MSGLPPKRGRNTSAAAGTAPTAAKADILVAEIIAPHGVKGAVSAESYSDNPRRFSVGSVFYSEDGRSFTVTASATHKGRLLLSFAEVADRTAAEALRRCKLYAEESPQLPEGSYYHYQLVGLEVRENGQRLGELVEVLPYTANDIYLTRCDDGEEILVPALKSVVRQIDLAGGFMEVELPKGLRD